jgi:hypothetical protein
MVRAKGLLIALPRGRSDRRQFNMDFRRLDIESVHNYDGKKRRQNNRCKIASGKSNRIKIIGGRDASLWKICRHSSPNTSMAQFGRAGARILLDRRSKCIYVEHGSWTVPLSSSCTVRSSGQREFLFVRHTGVNSHQEQRMHSGLPIKASTRASAHPMRRRG